MEPFENHNARPTPSFVRPFLYALNRMQANEILRPEQYMDRAKMLLVDRLGIEGPLPASSFAPGVVGIMADHTHYFDGFALVLKLRQGVAVAVRSNTLEHHRLVLEDGLDVVVSDGSKFGDVELSSLLIHVLKAVQNDPSRHVDVSIVGAVPTGLGASYVAAFTVALVKAFYAFERESPSTADVRTQALKALDTWYGSRFSPAYVIGSLAVQSETFVLIDTKTMSHLPLDGPEHSKLGWGIIEWSKDWIHSYRGAQKRHKKANKALEDVQKNGFPATTSFRELEHRDLERALDAVPRRSKSPLRFLVTENRNVQKLIIAIKKGDWQFFGALMMISQASKKEDWSTTDSTHDLITKEAETAALDGIFGVVQSGEGGCMLVFGQPFSVPAFLDRIKEITSSHTTEDVDTFII